MRVHTLIWADPYISNELIWFDASIKSTRNIILMLPTGADIGDILVFPASGVRLKVSRLAIPLELFRLQKALLHLKYRPEGWVIGQENHYVCEPNVSEPGAGANVEEPIPTKEDMDWVQKTIESVPIAVPMAA